MYRARPEFGDASLRFAPIPPYVLIYRAIPLEGLRFVDARRDLDGIVEELA